VPRPSIVPSSRRTLGAALAALSVVVAASLPGPARSGSRDVDVAGSGDGVSLADRLDAAAAETPGWHRVDALMPAMGAEAGDVVRILEDPEAPLSRRMLAAELLGRADPAVASSVLPSLRRVGADRETPEPLAVAVDAARYLLGETAPLDSRRREVARFRETPVARLEVRLALFDLHYRVGEFEVAGAQIADIARHPRLGPVYAARYRVHAACAAALAGDVDAAIDSLAAIDDPVRRRMALDDPDLSGLRDDPRVQPWLNAPPSTATTGAAETEAGFASAADPSAVTAGQSVTAAVPSATAATVEYDLDAWDRWLALDHAYRTATVDAPHDTVVAWVERVETAFADLRGTTLDPAGRIALFRGYAALGDDAAWLDCYEELLDTFPGDVHVGRLAPLAMGRAARAGDADALRARLQAVVDAHPHARSAAPLLLALARSADHRGDTVAAREAYERIAREHPDADEAADARRTLRDRSTLRPGQLAPDFERPDANDGILHLAALRGRPTVIVFWRPGEVMSERLWDSLRPIGREEGPRVALVGIALARSGLDVARGLDALTPPGRQLWDADGSLATLYAVGPTPRTFLLDPDGRIVARDVHGPTLERQLDELLARSGDRWPDPWWPGGEAAR